MDEESIFHTLGNKERLVDRVVNEIQRLIVENKLEPGKKLPPERELAEQIGVSRTVVREAMHILVTKGLLDTRHGFGTVVRQANQEQITEPLSLLLQTQGITLDELHQVRSILEVEIAGIAAQNASPDELRELAEIVERMEKTAGDKLAYIEADADFHHCLANMSHNTLLIMLLDSINVLMRQIRQSLSRDPELFWSALPDHRIILQKVAGQDYEGARSAMQNHLEHARSIQKTFVLQQSGEQERVK